MAVVAIPGDVDQENAGELHSELVSLLDRLPAVLIVDMTATTFCDSSGVAAVTRVLKKATATNTKLRLAVTSQIKRTFSLLQADRILDIYPSLGAALSGDAKASDLLDSPPAPADHDRHLGRP